MSNLARKAKPDEEFELVLLKRTQSMLTKIKRWHESGRIDRQQMAIATARDLLQNDVLAALIPKEDQELIAAIAA